jgi:hypothetical protein
MRHPQPAFAFPVLCLLLLPAIGAARAGAQGRVPDAPALNGIEPPSAQAGTAVEVTLTGEKLAGTSALLCRYSSFPDLFPPADRGVKAAILNAADGQARARLTLPKDAPTGLHEIRAVTPQGITAPQYFYVSHDPQVQEKEPNNDPSRANPVELPAALAGTIGQPEDQDCFAFTAKAGERLVFQVEGFKRYAPPQNSQNRISYLDSFLTLFDANGRELAYDDDTSRLDAFLTYVFPADGRYAVAIRDSLFRGRGDYHYRIVAGRQPVITAVVPPGGERGKRLVATVYGYNLDETGATSVRRAIDLPGAPGASEFRLVTEHGPSNPVPVIATAFPETSEVEPNDRAQDATPVITPAVCTGKFDRPQDVDGFRFQGQANQRLVVEVSAARLGSPVDTSLTLMTRAGRIVARADDSKDAAGRDVPDSRMEVTLSASEEYVVLVRNQTRSGAGTRFFYVLTLRTMEPRFTVGLRQRGVNERGQPAQVPVDSVTVRRGGSVDFEVALARIEEQAGDVTLRLNLPPDVRGLTLGQVVRAARRPGDPPTVPGQELRVDPNPVIANGQSTATLRLAAGPELAPGTYLNLYLRASGAAAGQPYVVDRPLWLTVSP